MKPLRYEIELTDEELRKAWIREDRDRRGLLSRAFGPILLLFGVATLASQATPASRLVALLALAYGFFRILRPSILLRRVLQERRKGGDERVKLTLDDEGITLERGGRSARFPWSDVTAAGEREAEGYFFYELRGKHRAPIPHRVVEDRDALRACFEAHASPKR